MSPGGSVTNPAVLRKSNPCPPRRRGYGQRDGGVLLDAPALAGHRDGVVPVGVLDPTVMVMVELPEPGAGIGLGLKLTVVPDGIPEADRADRAVETSADGSGDGRGPLISLLDAERGWRGGKREARPQPSPSG